MSSSLSSSSSSSSHYPIKDLVNLLVTITKTLHGNDDGIENACNGNAIDVLTVLFGLRAGCMLQPDVNKIPKEFWEHHIAIAHTLVPELSRNLKWFPEERMLIDVNWFWRYFRAYFKDHPNTDDENIRKLIDSDEFDGEAQRSMLGYICTGECGYERKKSAVFYDVSFNIFFKVKLWEASNYVCGETYPFSCHESEFDIELIMDRYNKIIATCNKFGLIDLSDLNQGGHVRLVIEKTTFT